MFRYICSIPQYTFYCCVRVTVRKEDSSMLLSTGSGYGFNLLFITFCINKNR